MWLDRYFNILIYYSNINKEVHFSIIIKDFKIKYLFYFYFKLIVSCERLKD